MTSPQVLRIEHVGRVYGAGATAVLALDGVSLEVIAGLTALENVALPRELDGIRVRQARREAAEALEHC